MKLRALVKKFWAVSVFAAAAGCFEPEIAAVRDFDPARYMGKWYEIARLPNWFEKGMTRVTAEYTLLEDGTIRVENRGIKNGRESGVTGVARLKGDADVGELEVSFFRPFYGDYRIIRLAPDYSCSVVMGSDRDYLWVLARTPEIPEEEFVRILAFLRENGFAVDDLIYPYAD